MGNCYSSGTVEEGGVETDLKMAVGNKKRGGQQAGFDL